jgi:hypothetical protein
MRIVSQQTPAPRLLNTVVPELRERPPERPSMSSRLKSVPLFSGNGRAIFMGLVLGAVLISAISILYVRHEEQRQHAEAERKLVPASTESISRPEPILVRINADLIHVTAISLGHPRLAIINGQQRAEGERVTFRTSANVAVTLQVLKIRDGRIELSDGTQVITANLELPTLSRPKS